MAGAWMCTCKVAPSKRGKGLPALSLHRSWQSLSAGPTSLLSPKASAQLPQPVILSATTIPDHAGSRYFNPHIPPALLVLEFPFMRLYYPHLDIFAL